MEEKKFILELNELEYSALLTSVATDSLERYHTLTNLFREYASCDHSKLTQREISLVNSTPLSIQRLIINQHRILCSVHDKLRKLNV